MNTGSQLYSFALNTRSDGLSSHGTGPCKTRNPPEYDNLTGNYGLSNHGVNKPLPGNMLAMLCIAGQLLSFEVNPLANVHCSQSKLSQDELAQLMKSTHFDKKELQQWYKGTGGIVSQLKLLEANTNATTKVS